MKNLMKFLPVAILILPLTASAQPFGGVSEMIGSARGVVNSLTTLMVAIALLVFFWGLAKFIFKVGGDEKATADGKRLMIWGVIALFVMVSIWGLVYFIGNQLFPGWGDGAYVAPPIPTFGN